MVEAKCLKYAINGIKYALYRIEYADRLCELAPRLLEGQFQPKGLNMNFHLSHFKECL
jgi:hypothetical protein